MFNKIFHWPGKNLVKAIPIILTIGFIVGYRYDTSFLKNYILFGTFLMIYPTMIGFKLADAFNLTHKKVVLLSFLMNFALIPILAYILGTMLLSDKPQMMAGLALASLLPTSGMTISWTMLHKGNVSAAIKITALSLIAGSLLTPWYLLVMVGKIVQVNLIQTFTTISVVVFLPLLLGAISFKLIRTKLSQEEFKNRVKPILPSASVWAMLFVIFTSISLKAKMILSQPEIIVQGFITLFIFYGLNFSFSTLIGRFLLKRDDAIALVYGTVMRNLSIALGLAVNTFGPQAALIVTLAFLLQVQGAAWYGKVADKLNFFPE